MELEQIEYYIDNRKRIEETLVKTVITGKKWKTLALVNSGKKEVAPPFQYWMNGV